MNSKKVITAATIAGSLAAALTMIATPVVAGPKPPQPTMDKCFGVALKGNRLCCRRRHDLRRHRRRRLSGQRLEIRSKGTCETIKTPKGAGSLARIKS